MTYYLFTEGEVSGPYSSDQVEHLCQTGGATRETKIREEGDVSWKPLGAVFPALNTRPAPLSVSMAGTGGGVLITGVKIPFWDMVAILLRFGLASLFLYLCGASVVWLVLFAVRVAVKP